MRLGSRSPHGFVRALNERNAEIQALFLAKVAALTEPAPAKVMLADSTVKDQDTFDPGKVAAFFGSLTGRLGGWSVQPTTTTRNEDVRRTFAKFGACEGGYAVSGHVSLQYHALLYYRPDRRVAECQRELADIESKVGGMERGLADGGDDLILSKLREAGHGDLDYQRLFEVFYSDDKLRESILGDIEGAAGSEFAALSEAKSRLLAELDSLLVETYQTVPVLIDDPRLVNGEDGCLCTFDVTLERDGLSEGLFDPGEVPEDAKAAIAGRLDEFYRVLQAA